MVQLHLVRTLMASLMAAALLAIAPVPGAHAVEPDEVLPDARLEARARKLSAELRCLVCQNQSIDDSHAPLARDLRLLVRERLAAGDDDKAVMSYIVARYGEFVLLKPTFGSRTIILWLAPLVLLVGGVVMVRRSMARSSTTGAAASGALSEDEEQRLAKLLAESEDPKRGDGDK